MPLNYKRIIPLTEARKSIYRIADAVQKGGPYTLTQHGRPKMVMISSDEYESSMETLDIMSDPKLAKELRESMKQGLDPDAVPFDNVFEKVGKNFRLKSSKHVLHPVQKKRRKKSK